jgi:DNA-binding MarR family transcriptional regulator
MSRRQTTKNGPKPYPRQRRLNTRKRLSPSDNFDLARDQDRANGREAASWRFMMTFDIVRIRRRNSVLAALEVLRKLHPGLSLTSVRAFLYTAENPDINVAELAKVCQMTYATASRVARSLASPKIERPLPPSLGLLDFDTNTNDPRQRRLRLSERGLALARRIDQLILAQIPIDALTEDLKPGPSGSPDSPKSSQRN